VPPFSLEKGSNHLASLEQVSMICFFLKKKREKKNKNVKGFMDHSSRALMSAKHTLTEDGPESVESGNGNETALYER